MEEDVYSVKEVFKQYPKIKKRTTWQRIMTLKDYEALSTHVIFHFAVIAPKTQIVASSSFQAVRDQEKNHT